MPYFDCSKIEFDVTRVGPLAPLCRLLGEGERLGLFDAGLDLGYAPSAVEVADGGLFAIEANPVRGRGEGLEVFIAAAMPAAGGGNLLLVVGLSGLGEVFDDGGEDPDLERGRLLEVEQFGPVRLQTRKGERAFFLLGRCGRWCLGRLSRWLWGGLRGLFEAEYGAWLGVVHRFVLVTPVIWAT